MELVLSGPGKNALSSKLLRMLAEGFERAGSEPVLLRGEGDAFSSGLDLAEVSSLDRLAMLDFLRLLERAIVACWLHPAPVVACINGHAIAGGAVIALCADWRVAQAGRAKIGLKEVALGVHFPPRVLDVVLQRLPRLHHERLVLGAELVGVEDAARLGLVDEVAGDALATARAKLEVLAAMPRVAYAAAKRAIRRVPPERESELVDSLPSWLAEETRERMLAAIKK